MTRSIGIAERMRWMSALAVSAALTLLVSVALHNLRSPASSAGSSASAAGSAGSTAPLDPRIATLAAQHPGQGIEAIVQFKPGVSPAQAKGDSTAVHARIISELHIIRALAVKLSAADARTLASNPDVHAISLNTAVTPQGGFGLGTGLSSNALATTYARTLGIAPFWRLGVTGKGVGVAVIDTGIAGDLRDFRSTDGNQSRVVQTAVTNPGASTVEDTYGHGTDVAGIIAGHSANGHYVGVAPEANLVSVKVADDRGRATVLDVIYGLQFAVDHKSDYNIRVINLSLNSTTPQSYKTDPLDAAAEAAWMHGIVVVAAAGNRGTLSDATHYAPANDPYVITVGAVDENGTPRPTDDTIASWSSRGTTQDGVQKPDVYAPGAHIISVLAPGSTFASLCPTCVVEGKYVRTSGTSMAAPMISGLVADLLQVHSGWTPDQVKGALTSPAASANPSIHEVNAVRLATVRNPLVANQGLAHSSLLDGATGSINYDLSSWSLSSWSVAKGALHADFALSSWSCASCSDSGTTVDPSLSSWSLSSWSTVFDQ
jgi:serine protease AprX